MSANKDGKGFVRLRPYQERAVREVAERVANGSRRIVVVAACGAGKTTIAAHIINDAVKRDQRVLFMAHRRELISQAYHRLMDLGIPEDQLGILMGQDKRFRPRAAVQVASVDTLRNRAKPPADIVFTDECVPAGTLVDGRPIEQLRVGDAVAAFNHKTGKAETSRVTHVFCSRPTALVTLRFQGGSSLTCTPNHPVFTLVGYVPANTLTPFDVVFAPRHDGRLRGVILERVEVHDDPAGLCPDGFVYNIEVDRHHNFFANGILTHNCHRATATSYRNIASHYPDAVHLGLTATPYRANGAGLSDAYDELLVVASPQELIDQGFLVEPRVFTVPRESLPDLSRVRTSRGDYEVGALSDAVDRKMLIGNIVEHWMRHAKDVRTVAFAVSIAHSQHIAEQFRAAGVAAEHLDGATPTDERDAILQRLETGETTVVSNCGVLCLDERTEILTTAGWTSMDEMTPDHLVAGFSDGEITFEKPTAVHRRARMPGERMVRFRSLQVDIRVTEGHGIVHRSSARGPWSKLPARECVGKGMFLPASGYAPALDAGECEQILEVLREVELKKRKAEGVLQSINIYDDCRRGLEHVQIIAACRGFRSRFCATRRPGRWALVLDTSKDVPVAGDDVQFEEEHQDEPVWCVTTRAGNIVTRRLGAVVVLGNCEGFDLPPAKCAILARPTRSTGLYLQQAGRILRPWNGQRAIILDHGGCAVEHGLPQADREFSLEGKQKKEQGKSSAPPVRVCPECQAIVPVQTRVCPECDLQLVQDQELPTVDEGTLVEVTAADMKKMELERLMKLSVERGYEPGWVYHRYKEKFGEAPPRLPGARPTNQEYDEKRAVRSMLKHAARSGGKLSWSTIAKATGRSEGG
jgi:superfamily II DNA or RNA helicase